MMTITRNRIDVACDVVVGALPQSAQGSPIAVRERSVSPTYVPMTGEVRPQSAFLADLKGHPSVQGFATGDVRVRTWSPPD